MSQNGKCSSNFKEPRHTVGSARHSHMYALGSADLLGRLEVLASVLPKNTFRVSEACSPLCGDLMYFLPDAACQVVSLSPPWLFELLNSRFQHFALHVVVHGLKKVQLSISTSSEDTAAFLKHTRRWRCCCLLPKTPIGEATETSLQGKDDLRSHRAWTMAGVHYKQGRTLPPVGASSLALVRRGGHDGQ